MAALDAEKYLEAVDARDSAEPSSISLKKRSANDAVA
jgi:hypothetical protein